MQGKQIEELVVKAIALLCWQCLCMALGFGGGSLGAELLLLLELAIVLVLLLSVIEDVFCPQSIFGLS